MHPSTNDRSSRAHSPPGTKMTDDSIRATLLFRGPPASDEYMPTLRGSPPQRRGGGTCCCRVLSGRLSVKLRQARRDKKIRRRFDKREGKKTTRCKESNGQQNDLPKREHNYALRRLKSVDAKPTRPPLSGGHGQGCHP